MRLMLVLFLCLAANSCLAQSQTKKIRIGVECDECKSKLAMFFTTSVHDALAKSPRYTEVPLKSKDSLTIHFATATGAGGILIGISGVITIGETYLGQWVQLCGEDNISNCGQGVIVMIDQFVEAQQDK